MLKKLLCFMLLMGFAAANEVNVYTHRHYDTDKKLFKMFEEQTGIKVNVVKAKAAELIKRLESEGKYTKADVLITVDAGRLYAAKAKGLFQSVESKYLNDNIPATYKDSDNQWFGLTKRARVIVYSKDRVKASDLSTYDDLTNPKWKGKILVRSSNNVYNQSLLASVIAHKGVDGAQKWAEGVVANMARTPKGNDRAQVLAVAAGVGDIAIVNTYYIGKMIFNKDKAQREAVKKVKVFFPNQDTYGTHVNVSGAGVTKHAKNKENAVKFIEFLASAKAQKLFAEANYEYPILKGVDASGTVKEWGNFKSDTAIDIELLGKLNAQAIKVFDKAGWR